MFYNHFYIIFQILERLAKIEGAHAHLTERIEDIETNHLEQNTTLGKNVPKAFYFTSRCF